MHQFVRCEVEGSRWYAEAVGERLHFLTDAPWRDGVRIGVKERASRARRISPITPSKIICVGKNYRAHAAEMGDDLPTTPLLFFKPPSSILEPGGHVVLPRASERVDFEGELGVVISKRASQVPKSRATEHVFGYVATCDVTARDLQKRDGQWTRAKGFDTFCPVAGAVTRGVDAEESHLITRVNGEVRQSSPISDMVFDVSHLIEFISHIMTLEPGDLILTGTPSGVGPLRPGDRVEVLIDHLEPLRFEVSASTHGA